MPKYPIHDSKYFDVREFVHPDVWNTFKTKSQRFVDPTIVRIADAIRERFGPCTINDWAFGGKRVASGFRAMWEKTGGVYSQHRAGRAADIKCKLATEKEMFEVINREWLTFKQVGLTRMEDVKVTVGWLHVDCAPETAKDQPFLIVRPAK